ncbi:MAG: hypothetical protein GX285_11675 [Clostridiales bacterium]|nr:hypothetical protein [Clostridiales bacterium]
MHMEKILRYFLIVAIVMVILIQALYQTELFDVVSSFISEKLITPVRY